MIKMLLSLMHACWRLPAWEGQVCWSLLQPGAPVHFLLQPHFLGTYFREALLAVFLGCFKPVAFLSCTAGFQT